MKDVCIKIVWTFRWTTTAPLYCSLSGNRTRCILMDEPTSALDPISTLKIEELVQELKKDYTIIIVTHNMQQAARISDKTAFFLNGELVEFDTNTMFSNPMIKEQKIILPVVLGKEKGRCDNDRS